MDKEFEKKMKKLDKEHEREYKRTKKIYENFAKEIFKKNPKIKGLMITVLLQKSKRQDYPSVNGVYIKNKKIKKEELKK
jgi:3-deoxy-D-arabino-heptulosonate 7-phosphate (DAHP) synthase